MDGLFHTFFTVMTLRRRRERKDHLTVIASGACLSTSDSNVDFQTPRKQTFINSRIES